MADLKNQMGFLPEMDGMKRIWSRDDRPGIVTGCRFIYQTKKLGSCKKCRELTHQVIDYLGKLSFCCGLHFGGK